MYKNGKWAQQLLALQDGEGKWGWFHSLSQFYNAPVTTEQALRRLELLGYTIEDACIQRAVTYMDDCLAGKRQIPDRVEKVSDWSVFSNLILSTWIRRFTLDNDRANLIAEQWAEVITRAFRTGTFHHEQYVSAYKDVLKPQYGRINHFANFYPVSLLKDCLSAQTERAFVEYLINFDRGIYYIYDGKISILPENFQSREASRYLGAVELLAPYSQARPMLQFVSQWLRENQNGNGKWDMGKAVNDKVYFPLSDDWRRPCSRELDCTYRVRRLLDRIE